MDINKLTTVKVYEVIIKDNKIVTHNAYQNEYGTIYLPYKNNMTYIIPKRFQNAIFSYHKDGWFDMQSFYKGYYYNDLSYYTTNIQFAYKILSIKREILYYHSKPMQPSLSVIDCTKFLFDTNFQRLILFLGDAYEVSVHLIVNREEKVAIMRFYNSNDNKEKLSNIKSSQELLNFFLSRFQFKKSISIKLNEINKPLIIGQNGRRKGDLRLVKKSIYDL